LVGKVSGAFFFGKYGEFLIRSYTALKVKFKFPDTVKYPNLPVRLDLNSVIFPLEGETFCTGNEFYLAMRLNCQIEILGGVYIPFITVKNQENQDNPKETLDETPLNTKETLEKPLNTKKDIFIRDPIFSRLENKIKQLLLEGEVTELAQFTRLKSESSTDPGFSPEFSESSSNFYLVVKELLTERLKYSKGSYMNLLYKFLANAGIGQMARGLNRKPRFDSKTNSTKILPSGELVSPLYAG